MTIYLARTKAGYLLDLDPLDAADVLGAWSWVSVQNADPSGMLAWDDVVIWLDEALSKLELRKLQLSGDRVLLEGQRMIGSIIYRPSNRGPVYLFPLTR